MAYRYAAATQVGADRSRAEIERLLLRFGADKFSYAYESGRAAIVFALRGVVVLMRVPLPDRDDPAYTTTETGRKRKGDAGFKAWEQETRRRWRALALSIKAKLIAVEDGVATFEQEFLAYLVVGRGVTVGDRLLPYVADAKSLNQILNVRGLPAPRRTEESDADVIDAEVET